MPEIYAEYLRKSRADLEAEARGEGETLARHRAKLTELASRRGLVVAEIYEEIVSGDTIAARPQMQRLLADVGAGKYAGVLCMDIDRLGRGDSIDQGLIIRTFEATGTRIITPYKDYDLTESMDAEIAEFKQFFGRFELRTIKRRMWAGRVASAKEGNWQSPRAPFGYRRIQLPDRSWTLEPIPDQADAVRMIYDLYLHGRDGETYGMKRLAQLMQSLGYKTFAGKPWTRSSIRVILENPVYIGMIRWGYRKTTKAIDGSGTRRPLNPDVQLYPGKHPAIVSRELYDAVQKKLAGHIVPTNDLQFPLAGLIYCSHCGYAILSQAERSRPCGRVLKCVTNGCPTTGIAYPPVERLVLDTLRSWITEAERPSSPAQPDAVDDLAIRRRQLRAQLDDLAARRTRIMDLLEQGVYTAEDYKQRSAAISDATAAAQAALDALDAPARSRADALRALVPQLRHVLDAYPAATPREQNELLRTVIDRIIYTKTVHGTRWHDPTQDLTLDIFPKI